MLEQIKSIFQDEYMKNNHILNYLYKAKNKHSLSNKDNKLNIYNKNKNRFSLTNNLHDFNFILFILVYFIISINQVYCFEKNGLLKLNCNSIIILTIEGSGNQYIISEAASSEISLPNRIQINDDNEITGITSKQQNLPSETNTVKMIWEEPLTTCRNMFRQLANIISIDLTNFDFSSVTDMGYFFDSCDSLLSINMANGNAINVQNMEYMFAYCSSLTSIDLTNFKAQSVKIMLAAFINCFKLEYLDLSNFETTFVTNMNSLFLDCSSLTSLDLSNFYTPSLTSMDQMFVHCTSLEFLDISNFKTDKITNMENLFNGCTALKSLDLSSFNTESVITMNLMFFGCISLTSLNLNNFYTPKLEEAHTLFGECHSLEYIDINNLNTSKIACFSHLFEDCYSLKYVDISNFDTSSADNLSNMFLNCFQLTSLKISNFKTELVTNMGHMFTGCKSLTSLNLSSFKTPILKFIDYMFYNCSSLEHLDISNFDTEKIENFEYMFYSTSSLKSLNLSNFMILEGINIDKILFNSNPNVILCYNESKVTSQFIESVNQYENSCKKLCNMDSKKFIPDLGKCVDNCYYSETEYKYEYQGECYTDCPIETQYNPDSKLCINTYNSEQNEPIDSITVINTYKNKTEIIRKIIQSLINNYNATFIENGNEMEITEENILIQLTTTKNEKDNENKSKVTIDIQECEDILKQDNNISNNDSLYIIKLIIKEDEMNIPKVEYEVYYPFNNLSLTQLSLEPCKDTKMEISIPVNIDGNIDKYNPNSKYYNDICCKTTSKSGTDISLKDRKNEYIEQNMTLCEENCKLIYYNYDTKKVKCSCDMKTNIPLIELIKFNNDDLYKIFMDIKNIINIKILKCFKEVFNGSLKHNYGFFIIIFVILLHIICLIIFLSKSYNNLKIDINHIVMGLQSKKRPIKDTNTNDIMISIKSKRLNSQYSKRKAFKGKNKLKKRPIKLSSLSIKELNNLNEDDMNAQNIKKKEHKSEKIEKKAITEEKNGQQNLEYTDYELDLMKYKKALKFDKRTYLEFYKSLLKSKHLFIFSFGPFKDYNSRTIKIFLFFFFFTIHLTINALFFNDTTMHKIYLDEGSYNFIYQIPQILYSSLISGVINSLIRFLSLSQSNIIKLKTAKKLIQELGELLHFLKLKFTLFFIITFILLLFCCYYIACFCGIYENTQTYLIEDSGFSFLLSLIYPFLLCLIPGIFRILSLRNKKGSLEFLYKLATLLMLII